MKMEKLRCTSNKNRYKNCKNRPSIAFVGRLKSTNAVVCRGFRCKKHSLNYSTDYIRYKTRCAIKFRENMKKLSINNAKTIMSIGMSEFDKILEL